LPGRRTQTWVKLKHTMTRDVIIVGWRTGTGERSPTFASLLLAAHDGNELVYLGRVGTGFDEHALTSLRSKLDRLRRKTPRCRSRPPTHAMRSGSAPPSSVRSDTRGTRRRDVCGTPSGGACAMTS